MDIYPKGEEFIEEEAAVGAPGAGHEHGAGEAYVRSALWRDAVARFSSNKGAVVAAVLFVLIVLFCVIEPFLSPYSDQSKINLMNGYLGPSWKHWLGTDQFGRDLLTRLALGGRVSITIGMTATLVIIVVGVLYGSIAGFIGGRLDNVMMRFLDTLYGLPYLPFAIITLAVVGTVNLFTMAIALSIVSWLTTARVVRGQVITLKQNDYVRAAHAIGARWYRVLGRHLLPNTLGVLVIYVFLELPGVVLGEAFLSFIGLGINPPDASWGSMAQEGFTAYLVHPAIILIPSLAIAALVLCSNFVADGLRDALDPRAKEVKI
jgi:oligopeptide transport system permease protein